jgi:hypothetical protein
MSHQADLLKLISQGQPRYTEGITTLATVPLLDKSKGTQLKKVKVQYLVSAGCLSLPPAGGLVLGVGVVAVQRVAAVRLPLQPGDHHPLRAVVPATRYPAWSFHLKGKCYKIFDFRFF